MSVRAAENRRNKVGWYFYRKNNNHNRRRKRKTCLNTSGHRNEGEKSPICLHKRPTTKDKHATDISTHAGGEPKGKMNKKKTDMCTQAGIYASNLTWSSIDYLQSIFQRIFLAMGARKNRSRGLFALSVFRCSYPARFSGG